MTGGGTTTVFSSNQSKNVTAWSLKPITMVVIARPPSSGSPPTSFPFPRLYFTAEPRGPGCEAIVSHRTDVKRLPLVTSDKTGPSDAKSRLTRPRLAQLFHSTPPSRETEAQRYSQPLLDHQAYSCAGFPHPLRGLPGTRAVLAYGMTVLGTH